MNISTSYPSRKICISSTINEQKLLGRLVVVDNTSKGGYKCNLVCGDSNCLWKRKFVNRPPLQNDAFYPDLSS